MKLVIHGRVQGVGYRYSIIEQIESNNVMVKGQISNLPNGTVQIIAHGDIETLKDIRRFALNGSSRSVVREIEEVIQEITNSPFDSFDISY
jgi:acylphosphatase